MTTKPQPERMSEADYERARAHAKKYLTTMQDGLGISQEGANMFAKGLLQAHKHLEIAVQELETVAAAEVWTAARNEQQYSGIDAGYAKGASEALKQIGTT